MEKKTQRIKTVSFWAGYVAASNLDHYVQAFDAKINPLLKDGWKLQSMDAVMIGPNLILIAVLEMEEVSDATA